MDGYAVRADDLRDATAERPVRLRVVATLPAGARDDARVGPGECARIYTGGPVPDGADAVVRQEDAAAEDGAGEARFTTPVAPGDNVRAAGEDVRRGELALDAGTALGPAQLGLLAALAVTHPLVHRAPRVALASTGDELADLGHADEILAGRRIGDANAHSLAALVREAGGEPVLLGIAADDPAALAALLEGARDCDLLVTTGGASVGPLDHVRTVMRAPGNALDFWRLRMRPGAPVAAGRLGQVPWVALPGNPVSAMVTFELLVRPAIRRLCGHRLPFRRAVRVHLAEPLRLAARLQHFLRVTLAEPDDGAAAPAARLTGAQGSGILTSMARAGALLVVPEGMQEVAAGTILDAIRLDEPRHRSDPAF
jgi:molybdopterin molybdotransferase